MFSKFPEVCFVNNVRDEAAFGAYKGLRKLRGNNVLLIEGLVRLNRNFIHNFLNRVNITVGTVKGNWSGVAFISMRDLDYMVRSLEFNLGKGISNAFKTLKDKYGIEPDYIELPD
jgi:predicted PP-loop superfamily ATPase